MSLRPAAEDGPILVVHPSPDLYGSDRMLVEVVRELVAAHGDVVVVLPRNGRLVPLLLRTGAKIREVPTLVLGKRLLTPRGSLILLGDAVLGAFAASRALRQLRPTSVYVNTLTLPLWPLLGRCSGARTVVHVHEAEPDVSGLVRAALALPLLPAHQLLVNSEFSRAVLAGSIPGSLIRRISLVPNGVTGPPHAPRPARRELRDDFRLVYVGRLSERKGVHLLIDTVSWLADRGVRVSLDVVGDVYPGYEWFEDALRRSVDAAGVSDRVRFCGFQADVWPWLDTADVVLVPSVSAETFGNAAVEAVLAARPVIVADHSGLREAVKGYGSAFRVDTRAPEASVRLAEALLQVRDKWDFYRLAAQNDALLARARHCPRTFGRQVAQAVLGPRLNETRTGGPTSIRITAEEEQ